MGSFSIWHWLVVLLIVALVFGTKKLRNMGTDLGGAVKGFKDGMKEANFYRSKNRRPGRRTGDIHPDDLLYSRSRRQTPHRRDHGPGRHRRLLVPGGACLACRIDSEGSPGNDGGR